MRKSHGIVGIIGWGLILPVGAIIARYFRYKDPLWFYLHSVIQFVGFSFGLGTVLLGLQLYRNMHVHIPAHRGIGIFVLVLSILQVCLPIIPCSRSSHPQDYIQCCKEKCHSSKPTVIQIPNVSILGILVWPQEECQYLNSHSFKCQFKFYFRWKAYISNHQA